MDINHRLANKEAMDYFLNEKYFNKLRNLEFVNSISTEKCLVEPTYSSFKRSPETKLGNHVLAIDFPDEEKRNIFLFLEKEEEEQCVLLISGETKTNELKQFNEFLIGQIKADKKAFKCGLICYPVYEMLHSVSKLIMDRTEEYSVTITGNRELVYSNDNAGSNMIYVNLVEGSFKVNKSESYIDYMPTLNQKDLRELIQHKCYSFADRLNLDLALAGDKPKIEETVTDCEIIVYSDRKQTTILCGRGNVTKKQKIINKVKDDVKVTMSPTPIPK